MGTLGGNICLENRCVYYNQSHTFQFVEPCFKRDGNLCYLIPKGNRCWAVSAGDTVPALVSLGVRVVVNGAEKRSTLPVEELFTGNSLRPLDLGPSQIVTEIEIPAAPGSRGASFMKFSLRGGLEFAALNVAVVLDLAEDRQTCVEAKVALGAIAAGPVRARKAEAALNGQKLVRDLFSAAAEIAATEIIPVPRHEFSVPYLRKCLESQTRDALTLAYQRGSGLAA
jgi:CO/xanthine dehydrogenase FAD-binding subunit